MLHEELLTQLFPRYIKFIANSVKLKSRTNFEMRIYRASCWSNLLFSEGNCDLSTGNKLGASHLTLHKFKHLALFKTIQLQVPHSNFSLLDVSCSHNRPLELFPFFQPKNLKIVAIFCCLKCCWVFLCLWPDECSDPDHESFCTDWYISRQRRSWGKWIVRKKVSCKKASR